MTVLRTRTEAFKENGDLKLLVVALLQIIGTLIEDVASLGEFLGVAPKIGWNTITIRVFIG